MGGNSKDSGHFGPLFRPRFRLLLGPLFGVLQDVNWPKRRPKMSDILEVYTYCQMPSRAAFGAVFRAKSLLNCHPVLVILVRPSPLLSLLTRPAEFLFLDPLRCGGRRVPPLLFRRPSCFAAAGGSTISGWNEYNIYDISANRPKCS